MAAQSTSGSQPESSMEKFFKIRERGSDVRTEVLAGIATFMTMAYIIFVNPSILFGGPDKSPLWAAAVVATCLAAGITTIAMGLFANWPLALAAGMGLNAVVAFGLVAGMKLPYSTAMGVIVVEGFIVTILVLTKVREKIMDAIPNNLKRGIGVGIGIFIAFIGANDGGLLVAGGGTPLSAANWWAAGPALTLIGLVITIAFLVKKVKGALLWGILSTTVIAIIFETLGLKVLSPGALANAAHIISIPNAASFATIGHADVLGVLTNVPLWGMVFAIMMTDFFDTMGTVVSIGEQAKMLTPEGKVPGLNRILLVDSLAAMVGGFFGISSNTTYIESASGVGEGGRTGLTSVVTGLLFFVALFFTPIIGLVPAQATAPALMLVGFMMFQTAAEIDFTNWTEAIPAFVTILMIPLTYSIARGVGVGFVSYALLKLITGKSKDVSWLVWIVSLFFLVDMFGLWSKIFG